MKGKSYRELVLEMEPRATIKGPFAIGRYTDLYSVYDAAGKEIGWTDGNEAGASWAWLRAYSTLLERKKAAGA